MLRSPGLTLTLILASLTSGIRGESSQAVKPVDPSSALTPPRVISSPKVDASACGKVSRSHWEVSVNIVINKQGKPERPSIATSSGDACLDAVALRTATAYSFDPAMEQGNPIASQMKIIIQAH